MATRILSSTTTSTTTTTEKATATTNGNGSTTYVRCKQATTTAPPGISYLVCDDPNNHSPFVNPMSSGAATTRNKNKTTNKKSNKKNDDGDGDGGDETEHAKRSSKNNPWPSRNELPSWIPRLLEIVDLLFVNWWIMPILGAYHEHVPLPAKRWLVSTAWKIYVRLHTVVVCGWMGHWLGFYTHRGFYNNSSSSSSNHDGDGDGGGRCGGTMSDGFKAFSSLMYPAQFFCVTVERMRWSLSEMNSVAMREVPSEDLVERIRGDESCNNDNNHRGDGGAFVVPGSQKDYQAVSGLYVTNPKSRGSGGDSDDDNHDKNTPSEANRTPKKVLFWVYGGAYLAGDAEGNLSIANEFLVDCGLDEAFLPSYRLAPEAGIDDVLWDICWSYRYLLRRLERDRDNNINNNKGGGGGDDHDRDREQQHPGKTEIVMAGVSSGGALILRLLQLLRDRQQKRPLVPPMLEPLVDDILARSERVSSTIAGALMFGPYVDYRDPQPPRGSFVQNAQYDWIVTEAIQNIGLPYINGFIPPFGDDLLAGNDEDNKTPMNTHGRIAYSPLCHDMKGLPPLCLIVGEHEACYDMSVAIANKARETEHRSNSSSNKNNEEETKATDVTIAVWKHMCHVFSMLQGFFPEGEVSIGFAKKWILSKTTSTDRASK